MDRSTMRDRASLRAMQARKLLDSLGTPLARDALRAGVASAWEHRAVLASLRPSTVIDVGANRGQFALEVRRTVERARVISFEPLADAADTFESIFAADPQVELRRRALGPTAGQSTLHVSRSDDSSSLLAISDLQTRMFPGTGEVGTVEVVQSTLDDELRGEALSSPVMLKIDVQGGELGVIEGGMRALAEDIDWVYVECSFRELYEGQPLAADLVAALAEAGLHLSGIGNTSTVNRLVLQADLLFSSQQP